MLDVLGNIAFGAFFVFMYIAMGLAIYILTALFRGRDPGDDSPRVTVAIILLWPIALIYVLAILVKDTIRKVVVNRWDA